MRSAIAFLTTTLVAGCVVERDLFDWWPDQPGGAVAQLEPIKGSNVRGKVTFAQTRGIVRMVANITGLEPGREFGFHIHEVGDCSGEGMSAGGHFNPLGMPHGNSLRSERHAGDLPNLRSDQRGRASMAVELDIITVLPGPTSIVGRALIVHEQRDDFRTQPTGNAGAPSACGVIEGRSRPN